MENKKIYSVECNYFNESQFIDNKWSAKAQIRSRRWGFYFSMKEAFTCVKENWTDIYENNYYNYVVITEEHPGITSFHLRREWWFKVSYIDNHPVVKLVCDLFPQEMSRSVQDKIPDEVSELFK